VHRCDDDRRNVNKQLIDFYVFCEIDEQEADRPVFLEESQQVKIRTLTLDNLAVSTSGQIGQTATVLPSSVDRQFTKLDNERDKMII
jgi:hypothetical protein